MHGSDDRLGGGERHDEAGVLGDHRDGLHDETDNDRDRHLQDVTDNDRDRHLQDVADDDRDRHLQGVADDDRDGHLHGDPGNDRGGLHDGVGATVDHHDDLQGDRDELLVPSQRTADVTPGVTPAGSPGDVLIATDAQEHVPAHAVPYQGQTQPQNLELFEQDTTQLRERWRDVQSGFVDEPRESVERADQLIDEVVTSLTTALSTRTNELRDRWKNTDDNDTEQLRLALRDYRQVLERLMSLSGTEGR
ncbi:hypothetical protein [Nonomuraea soli]|uniref:Uncharacterized protein n=1 Tax=Nonomuraea soli TaxID=1032476 RepID=A0A7W0CF22_9ACTN|nr:hypothetical protein [Nonomuraea soli]MBA2889954.1 hypothetical protein [Nonomuraea soli]